MGKGWSIRAWSAGLLGLLGPLNLLGLLLAPAVAMAQPAPPSPPAVPAQPAGSFSVTPAPDVDIEQPKNPARERVPASRSWFTFRGEPGQVIQDSLRVVNTGAVPVELLVYAVDATTGSTTGMVMHNRDAPRQGVGTWVQVSEVAQPALHLEPGKVADVEFTVRVPANARPGEHWGGLMVEDTNVRRGTGQFAVNQVFRAGVALGVTLPGPRVERLVVRGVSSRIVNDLNQVFVIELANEGNVLVKSKGTIELKDRTGRVAGQHELTLDNVLPGTTVPYELFWPKESLPAGRYEASVTLAYSPAAGPATLTVRDLEVETPGMRLVPATPASGAPPAGGEASAFNVVPAAGAGRPPVSQSGPWQTVLAALAGGALVGAGMVLFQFIRRRAGA